MLLFLQQSQWHSSGPTHAHTQVCMHAREHHMQIEPGQCRSHRHSGNRGKQGGAKNQSLAYEVVPVLTPEVLNRQRPCDLLSSGHRDGHAVLSVAVHCVSAPAPLLQFFPPFSCLCPPLSSTEATAGLLFDCQQIPKCPNQSVKLHLPVEE